MADLVHDHLESFDQGVNSGLDPFSLPPKQCAFAINATFRGNFVRNRPPYNLQALDLSAGTDFDTVLNSTLFQGACYVAPDTGPQQLCAQIGGRLFIFTPSATSNAVTMQEVTVPGDPNSGDQPVAWLRQLERWVVVNNGLQVPIFYDTGSQTSRRSLPDSVVQGTSDLSSQPFTPVLNGTMVLLMTAPYTGPINQAIQLVEYDNNNVVSATTNYVVVNAGGGFYTYNVTLKNLGDVAGAIQGINSPVNIQPNVIGNARPGTYSTGPSGGVITTNLVISNPLPSSVVFGTSLTINGNSGYIVSSIGVGRTTAVLHRAGSTIPVINSGYPVYLTSGSSVVTTVGLLAATFTAPAVGSSVITQLQAAYVNAVGQIVIINNKQYQLTNYNPVFTPPGTNNVTLQNLNDSRTGHQFNLGTNPTKIFNFPELPVGRMVESNRNRAWECLPNGITFLAGDQVGGPSGSPAYQFRDAILKVSENDLLANGGFFSVPSNLGQITAMRSMSQPDASLGQGPLMIVTPGGVFSCDAPTDRTTWSKVTNPIVSETLIGLGGLSQNSTIVVNGDLMFRAVDGIRSLIMARRDYWSWGNTPISFEMSRVIDSDNPAGLPYVSAVQFDNRMLMGSSPTQGPQGVFCRGLIALNFDPISSLQGKGASVYDGLWTGINVLQIIEGQFNGVHRCFAFTYSETENKIQLYEILKSGEFDNGTTPITWSFEQPVIFRDPNTKGFYDLISIEDSEFYIKDVKPGQSVDCKVEYRPDFSNCWYPWHEFTYCNDRKSTVPVYGDRLGLGKPPELTANGANYSSVNFGRWFQKRYTFNGHCIFMGDRTSAARQPQSQYAQVIPSQKNAVIPTVLYENSVVASNILCPSGVLTFTGTLPRWMTMQNGQIFGAKGYFTGYSQAEANQRAMDAVCKFINDNISQFSCVT